MHEEPVTLNEDDQDSLFGSPPPSPRVEGRAASPALALPSAASTNKSSLSASTVLASAIVGIQNVGTIALPGSQPDSEFPIHPLALSLNHGIVPRPPALPQKQSRTTAAATSAARNEVSSAIANPSRSAATAPPTSHRTSSSGKAKKRSQPSQSRFRSEPATEPALEFTMPDPSAPPPLHFLRSQENLLGKAGRVGGITTALPQPRGSTPSNPILLDDDDATPLIGCRSKSRETSVDPMKLAQPTDEEIVSVLVGQKDIFPVLESILKLIAKGIQPKPPPKPQPTGFERRPAGLLGNEWSASPPAKKRKLNRVPAGATDWDVPFPFAEGEGPTAYHQNWERDRGKHLIAELTKLIKVAARKAAAKKYIAQKSEGGNEEDADTSQNAKGYYRPQTAWYGREAIQLESGVVPESANFLQLGLAPASGQLNHLSSSESSPQPAVPASVSSSQEEVQQCMDELLSSFMGSPAENTGLLPSTAIEASATLGPPTTDKTAFDMWMNILEAFPVDFGGTGASTQVSHSENTNLTTLFSPSLFDFKSITPNVPETFTSDICSAPSLGLNDFASESICTPGNPLPTISSVTSNAFVDPNACMLDELTRPPSPPPSASSESQAVTPASANWDFSVPDIFSGSNGDEEGQGMWRDSLWPMFDVTQCGFSDDADGVAMDLDLGGTGFVGTVLDAGLSSLQRPAIDKGKGKELVDPSTAAKTVPQFGAVTQSAISALLSSKTRDELLACLGGSASSSTSPSIPAAAFPTKRSNETESERTARLRRKEDVIQRAKERRREIQEDLENVKRQLWETTIEQAALIQLTNNLEAESNEAGQS